MFFRAKRTPSGSVLQLLEAYRNGEGLPRQRVVVSLGNANLPKSLRRIVARAIELKLYAPGDDLAGLELPWSRDVRHWIDSIYRRIVRGGRWSPLILPGAADPTQPSSVGEGVINGVIPQEIEHTHSVSLGPILVARTGWETLGMPQLLCDLGLNRAQRDAAAVSVIHRLVEPLSEHALIEWIPTSALPELYGEAILQGGWNRYMRLSQAEEGFCALKSDWGLRPNFHQKEKRVDAHIFITGLAYHVWKWIVHTLRQAGDSRDWVTVKRVLQTHGYATVQLKTREGKVYHLRKPGVAETRQEELYKLFRVRVEGLPKSQQVVEADMKMKL